MENLQSVLKDLRNLEKLVLLRYETRLKESTFSDEEKKIMIAQICAYQDAIKLIETKIKILSI